MISILFFFFTSLAAQALELEFLHQAHVPHRFNVKKTKVGGLSGLYWDSAQDKWFAVSDDRGNVNEPRIYEFRISPSLKGLQVEAQNVILLSVNENQLSHQSTKSKSKLFSKVLDLEGLSVTPWGDFLLINEGDMNRKPRVAPQVFSSKTDGTIQKDFQVPEAFLPELSGEQKKGVRNNFSFEGLAANPNGKEWIVATEGALIQDSKSFVRFVQYHLPEAWVLKPQKEFRYPIDSDPVQIPSNEAPESRVAEFQKGISEVLFLDDHRLLVLERALILSPQGMAFRVRIFETDLAKTGPDQLLTKKLVFDFSDLAGKTGKIENFEGMTLGPKLSDGRRSLILVSDDNFMRDQRTQFLLFAIKE